MALLFPRKMRPVLGLDIGATVIKMVELRCMHQQLWLQRFAVVPFPHAAALSAAIQEAYTQMCTATRDVAIAMPAAAVISKTLQVDVALPEEELEAHIQLEAAAALPFPLDEMCMDFSVLGCNEINPAKADVLLVAARKAQVALRCDSIISAGLAVDSIDVEIFALERVVNYLNHADAVKTIALFHFDETTITFMVLHQRRVIYTHEELYSVQQLTETIESLVPLLHRAMQFFISSIPNHPVESILLSGLRVSVLSTIVADELSLPVTIVNPFQAMSLAAVVNESQLQQQAATLTIACGLALRGVKNYGRN
jgi:type IV pilus assembly protein PilM